MISKRFQRPSRAQENFRQFALNNSKGVDSTKAPIDPDTLYRAENLVVTPDGSVSLRKPLEVIRSNCRANDVIKFTRERRIFDPEYVLQWDYHLGGVRFSVYDTVTRIYPAFQIRYTTHYGELKFIWCQYSTDYLFYIDATRIKDLEVINLSTSTIIGGVRVAIDAFPDLVNKELYPNETYVVPRYLNLYFENDVVILEIKSPELTRLNTAEGEIPLNPNTTLDNPYAIRDNYGAVVPYCRGIVPYIMSKPWGEDFIPIPIDYTEGSLLETVVFNVKLDRHETPWDDRTETVNLEFKQDDGLTCTVEVTNWKRSGLQKAYTTIRAHLKGAAISKLKVTGTYTVEYSMIPAKEFEINADLDPNVNVWEILNVEFQRDDQIFVQLDLEFNLTRIVNTSPVLDTGLTVAKLTESVEDQRYRPIVTLAKNSSVSLILKAFCDIPSTPTYYAAWYRSIDGIHWNPMLLSGVHGTPIREVNPFWEPSKDVDVPEENDYITSNYYPFSADSERDFVVTNNSEGNPVHSRVDVLCTFAEDPYATNARYRFKIVSALEIDSDDPAFDASAEGTQRKVYAVVSQQEFVPNVGTKTEFLDYEFGNTVLGEKLYYKKAIYSYGSEKFYNNIFVSAIDSFETPLYNIIDTAVSTSNGITCVVPWRDYLVSSSESSIHLHSKQGDGYLTKIVNASIGIPKFDGKCCEPILNGILFKSGARLYQLYPNMYSGDDSTLNISDVSKPIEEYLEEYEDYVEGKVYSNTRPFAFSTEEEYVLMLPYDENSYTICLRYNYTHRIWNVCKYDAVFEDYNILSLNDIRLHGTMYEGKWICEFRFDSEFKYIEDATNPSPDLYYGDMLIDEDGNVKPTPIPFYLDTGYKTASISTTNQFVESKMIFATEDDIEAFPLQVTIAIDGDTHVTVTDVNSDAPFWKTSTRSVGVAGTSFRVSGDSGPNVLRQLITRYSGRGKAIRHILTGTPSSNFRLYETYVRYKMLNVKR